jgi:hypothetical protein
MHACMLQGCLWIDSPTLNLLIGKKRKKAKKQGNQFWTLKQKNTQQQQQHKTLKLIPFAPTHIQQKEILMRARSKYTSLFYKGTTTHKVKKTQRREANSGQQ